MRTLLQNPYFLILTGIVIFGGFTVIGIWLIHRMRKQLTPPVIDDSRKSAESNAFAIAAYDAVIRKMKDQEKELEQLRRSDRDRAAESASISEAVLSNLPSGVVLFNTMSLVKTANPAARELLGFATPYGLHARDVFRGISAARFPASELPPGAELPPEGKAQLVKAVELALKQSAVFRRVEADYKSPSGTTRVLGITISPVRGANEENIGAACLVSDLTEITQLANLMRVKESMAALGEMSAGIAHEFKNSLATISGYAQMLEQGSDPVTGKEFAGKISSETTNLSRIVTDFLNFARPQGTVREPVALLPMLDDCAREAQVEIDFANFPESIVVVGDPTSLRQAFSNLLRNSQEAARPGVSPIVKASAKQDGPAIKLTLADNGVGIPKEDLERVFIPFFTTKAKGTGLGLALVHRIFAEHGGGISAESTPDGSTFTITLPAA